MAYLKCVQCGSENIIIDSGTCYEEKKHKLLEYCRVRCLDCGRDKKALEGKLTGKRKMSLKRVNKLRSQLHGGDGSRLKPLTKLKTFALKCKPPAGFADKVECTAYNNLAMICGEYLKKGRLVAIEGYYSLVGKKKMIIVENMQMLD